MEAGLSSSRPLRREHLGLDSVTIPILQMRNGGPREVNLPKAKELVSGQARIAAQIVQHANLCSYPSHSADSP